MKNIVIGIEGYVGAGKTTICKELLKKIPNSILLEGGNLYRAIVYALMHYGIDLEKMKQNIKEIDIKDVMDKLKVELALENNITNFYINGKKIEEEKLQSAEASLAVSKVGTVANNEKLFEFARNLIDNFKTKYNVIVSGRALMQIYPGLDYHFLIKASLEERIRRKSIQYKGKVDLEELKQNIVTRDELQEKAGFYKVYDKTTIIDITDCKTVEDSADKVLEHICIKEEV